MIVSGIDQLSISFEYGTHRMAPISTRLTDILALAHPPRIRAEHGEDNLRQ